MNIYVLDSNLSVLGIIDTYSSVIWTTRYFNFGDFELCVSPTSENLTLLAQGNYLVRDKDITSTAYKNVMIIINRQITTDEESGDTLIVAGYCLKSILSRRVVSNQTNLSGTVLSCIRTLINNNIISPTDSNRQISNFILGTDTATLATTMTMQITGDNLNDAISEICTTYGLGYDVYINPTISKFVFYIYEGEDRSYNQNSNPYVIFSTEFDNLMSSDYKNILSNYANAAYVAGEGEGTDRTIVEVGTATGLSRYETWVDARNSSSNNGEISQSDYEDMLSAEGEETLAEMTAETSFEGDIDNSVNFIYGTDYFLGDIVQVENDYGISAVTRILECIESEDESGSDLVLTLSEMEV